jgi:hypothetical protein
MARLRSGMIGVLIAAVGCVSPLALGQERPHAEAWKALSRKGAPADAVSAWPRLMAFLDRYERVQTEIRRDAKATEKEHGWQGDFGEIYDSAQNLAVIYETGDVRLGMARARKDLKERVVDAGIFQELDALAAEKSFARVNDSGPMLLWPRGYVETTRWLVRANLARLVLAIRDGDDATALRAFESGLALGRALMEQPTSSDAALGVWTTVQTLGQARYQACSGVRSSELLRSMLAAIDRQGVGAMNVDGVIAGERLMTLDTVDAVLPPDGSAPDSQALWTIISAINAPAGEHTAIRLPYYDLPPRAMTMKAMDEYFAKAAEMMKQTGAERWRIAAQLPAMRQALDKRDQLSKLLLQPLERVAAVEPQLQLETAAARLVLGLELHRVTRGFYPSTLAELVPGVLKVIPADPYSPGGFIYRLVLSPSATIGIELDGHGQPVAPYLLYSVGADGVDNGGSTHPMGPQMATHNRGVGHDVVLSYQPPPEPILRKIGVDGKMQEVRPPSVKRDP